MGSGGEGERGVMAGLPALLEKLPYYVRSEARYVMSDVGWEGYCLRESSPSMRMQVYLCW